MIFKYRIKGRRFISIAIVISIFGNIFSVKHSNILFLDDLHNATYALVVDNVDKRYTISTEGCIIPNVNPNDMSIRRFLNAVTKRPPSCPHHDHRLVTDNATHITVHEENFKFYKIGQKSRMTCCYKSFYRPQQSNGIPNKKVDTRIKYSDCITFHDIIKVNHEFVNIRCSYNKKDIYNQFFVFTPKKPFTLYRANPFSSDRSLYNVIIMGIGSVSRQNFYRTMPKTWNMLKNYEAVELKGYNTVAVDNFQNLLPVLLGMNSSEVHSTCWPKIQDTLDNCPYIWERFKDVGYYTALAEDTAKHGVFNTGKFGFRGSPTDYYIHPFIQQSETVNVPRTKKTKTKFPYRIHKKPSMPEPIPTCMGDKYYFEVLLGYIESLTSTLRTTRLFGLFWESSMSHDNLGSPQIMDDAYVRLLKHLDSTRYLENSIFIFLSDHGMDIGNIHLTKQGQIEQRQPLLYIFTPETFRIEFKLAYQNLKLNKDRLTTPFDVHQTLIDLLDLSDLSDREIAQRSKEFYSNERGISLFLPIPGNRTCEMAGINNQWCNCYKYIKVTLSSYTKIDSVYQLLTKHLNEPLKTYSQCAEIAVVKIIQTYEMVPGYEKNVEWRDFKIILKASPGGGVFEALLRYYKRSDHWVLVNAIKRLNVNNRNDCVDDDFVKIYCYCTK